jgi:hypothetical protein
MQCAKLVIVMPSTFTTSSSVCGHKASITAKLKASNTLEVDIVSKCKIVNDYAALIKEIQLNEIHMLLAKNPIILKASEAHIHPNCLVPCGVAFATWTESEMIAKTLLLHHKSQCIVFKEKTL